MANDNVRVLRWPEVSAKVGFTRQYISKLIARGDFPEPLQLGRNSVGFLESEIDDWIRSRPRGPIGKPHLHRVSEGV